MLIRGGGEQGLNKKTTGASGGTGGKKIESNRASRVNRY